MRITSHILGQKLTLDDILDLHAENPQVIVEKQPGGALVLEEPSGFYAQSRKAELIFQLSGWNNRRGRGLVTDSSTGFLLPNDALRSPDAAWISKEKVSGMENPSLARFLALVPDFVIELRTEADRLHDLISKMKEYQSVGVRLGWLLDPDNECSYVFRHKGAPEVCYGFDTPLSGEPELAGFRLDLKRLMELRER